MSSMENVTYPIKKTDVAEIIVKGVYYKFKVPPAIGTHSECFSQLSSDSSIKVAQGIELAVYAVGALDSKRQNEWLNQDLIKFPTQNYLRVPVVLTIVPKRKEFGELEGGMLVDSDLEGKGVAMDTEVPEELSEWTVDESGLLVKDNRIFVPYNNWFKEQWDENNGAAIAFFEREGAEMLVKARIDSGRTYAPLWKVDVNKITIPERRVPVLDGFDDDRLDLFCSVSGGDGDRAGCASGVFDSAQGAAKEI